MSFSRGRHGTKEGLKAKWGGYFGYLMVKLNGDDIEVRESNSRGVKRIPDRALTFEDARRFVKDSIDFVSGKRFKDDESNAK